MKLNNSEGISPWYLLLGGLASFSNLTNVAILQAPYLSCCLFVVAKNSFDFVKYTLFFSFFCFLENWAVFG